MCGVLALAGLSSVADFTEPLESQAFRLPPFDRQKGTTTIPGTQDRRVDSHPPAPMTNRKNAGDDEPSNNGAYDRSCVGHALRAVPRWLCRASTDTAPDPSIDTTPQRLRSSWHRDPPTTAHNGIGLWRAGGWRRCMMQQSTRGDNNDDNIPLGLGRILVLFFICPLAGAMPCGLSGLAIVIFCGSPW
jgi:hypothetical protein